MEYTVGRQDVGSTTPRPNPGTTGRAGRREPDRDSRHGRADRGVGFVPHCCPGTNRELENSCPPIGRHRCARGRTTPVRVGRVPGAGRRCQAAVRVRLFRPDAGFVGRHPRRRSESPRSIGCRTRSRGWCTWMSASNSRSTRRSPRLWSSHKPSRPTCRLCFRSPSRPPGQPCEGDLSCRFDGDSQVDKKPVHLKAGERQIITFERSGLKAGQISSGRDLAFANRQFAD